MSEGCGEEKQKHSRGQKTLSAVEEDKEYRLT
jgi:hypothetical protein